MAEDDDDASKTEDPTGKRLDDAREKGHIPVSQDVKHLFVLMSVLVVVAFLGPGMARDLTSALIPFMEQAHQIPLDRGGIVSALGQIAIDSALILVFPVLIVLVGILAASWLQNGFLFTAGPLAWDLNKLSPISGFKRVFSLNGLVELVKGLLKMAIVAVIVGIVLWPRLRVPDRFTEQSLGQMMTDLFDLTVLVLITIVAVQIIIAGIDLLYQRWNHTRQLRMTRHEVKEEYKQMEGDPQVKARIRSLRMDRARRRMMAAVPTADVIVTNPTHYAVALKYDPNAMAAPRLVAKGTDLVALKIREIAEEADVPIVENPPVARALFATVEIDQEIPSDQYRAVAEIISFVFKLKRRVMPS
jgi:flagellar biosynthesis protein FlhB